MTDCTGYAPLKYGLSIAVVTKVKKNTEPLEYPVVSYSTELGFLALVNGTLEVMKSRARQAIDNTATTSQKYQLNQQTE
jgi:hypothetical protein